MSAFDKCGREMTEERDSLRDRRETGDLQFKI
jgi:hypothetical protein